MRGRHHHHHKSSRSSMFWILALFLILIILVAVVNLSGMHILSKHHQTTDKMNFNTIFRRDSALQQQANNAKWRAENVVSNDYYREDPNSSIIAKPTIPTAIITSLQPLNQRNSDLTKDSPYMPKIFKTRGVFRSAVYDIDEMLNECHKLEKHPYHDLNENDFKSQQFDSKEALARKISQKKFEGLVRPLLTKHFGEKPLDPHSFVCHAECAAEEPELEHSFRPYRVTNYTLKYLSELCNRGDVPALIWINNNKLKYYKCRPGRIHGSAVWGTALRMMYLLTIIVKLPNMMFAFDNCDWAIPQQNDDFGNFGWLFPQPAVMRFVTTDAHPQLLFPTGSFVVATALCDVRSDYPDDWLKVCMYHPNAYKTYPWETRSNDVLWRGAMTGVPFESGYVDFLPRPHLTKLLKDKPGFNVGFTEKGGITSSIRKENFEEKHSFLDTIDKGEFANYKYIIHVDGMSASWGLAHKLLCGSAVLWHESLHTYREFYYRLLKPWEHYLPVASDWSNIFTLKDWLDGKNEFANDKGEQSAHLMARRATRLLTQRLRANDLFCYLFRMFYSLAGIQEQEATPHNVAQYFDLHKFITPEDYRRVALFRKSQEEKIEKMKASAERHRKNFKNNEKQKFRDMYLEDNR